MTHREDSNGIIIDMIQSNIAAVAEFDQPFPILRLHILDRATDMGLMGEYLNSSPDGLHGALRRVEILGSQEAI